MNTTLDLFEAATVSLTRPTSIKERLADAYLNYLAYVHEDDLPADVCEEFRALTDTLTRVSPELRGDDALRATVRKMSTDDAAAAAFAGVYMRAARPADCEHRLRIEQGYEMGRPSLIELTLTVRGGGLVAASIAGEAVVVTEGSIEV